MLVDSHCHLDRLDLTPFDGDLSGALFAATTAGVGHLLCVCIDLENFPAIQSIAQEHPHISLSVGVHPNETTGREPGVDELVRLAKAPGVVAIGETGLDYFRSEGDLSWQHERFCTHISASKQSRKPLIIHMRDATDDTLRILKEEGASDIGGVMHCFVEDWETAKRALDLNFLISFSGIVTFKSATKLHEVAQKVPADRMLIETDSPYLAPVPYRGKSNQPAYVYNVAQRLAELRGTTIESVAELTTRNYFSLFSDSVESS